MAQAGVSANRLELLQIADAVAREKSIEREIVIGAMEEAIQRAARSRYGLRERDPRRDRPQDRRDQSRAPAAGRREGRERLDADLDHGSASAATRLRKSATSSPSRCRRSSSAASPRRSAKQVIVQKVRDAERQRQFEEFKDRVGEIVHGVVKRVEYGNVVIDLGRGEAIIRRDQLLPRETFRNGDRVRAYIYDVRRETRGPQIFLSRTSPDFMARLFAQEVPEVYDGVVEIRRWRAIPAAAPRSR